MNRSDCNPSLSISSPPQCLNDNFTFPSNFTPPLSHTFTPNFNLTTRLNTPPIQPLSPQPQLNSVLPLHGNNLLHNDLNYSPPPPPLHIHQQQHSSKVNKDVMWCGSYVPSKDNIDNDKNTFSDMISCYDDELFTPGSKYEEMKVNEKEGEKTDFVNGMGFNTGFSDGYMPICGGDFNLNKKNTQENRNNETSLLSDVEDKYFQIDKNNKFVHNKNANILDNNNYSNVSIIKKGLNDQNTDTEENNNTINNDNTDNTNNNNTNNIDNNETNNNNNNNNTNNNETDNTNNNNTNNKETDDTDNNYNTNNNETNNTNNNNTNNNETDNTDNNYNTNNNETDNTNNNNTNNNETDNTDNNYNTMIKEEAFSPTATKKRRYTKTSCKEEKVERRKECNREASTRYREKRKESNEKDNNLRVTIHTFGPGDALD